MPPTVTVNEVLADPPPVDTLNESENNEGDDLLFARQSFIIYNISNFAHYFLKEQETDDPMHPGVSEN